MALPRVTPHFTTTYFINFITPPRAARLIRVISKPSAPTQVPSLRQLPLLFIFLPLCVVERTFFGGELTLWRSVIAK